MKMNEKLGFASKERERGKMLRVKTNKKLGFTGEER